MKKLSIAGLMLLLAAAAATAPLLRADSERDGRIMRNLSAFTAVVRQVEANYVDTLDVDKAMRTAIDAYLSHTDPYTEYYTDRESRDFAHYASGEYGGIGSYIMKEGDYVVLTGPYEDSPATEAGLKAGDKILSIDSLDMKGKTMETVRNRLMGPAGTRVRLKVVRPFTQDSIVEVEVERRKVQIPSISYSGEPIEGIGYIKLDSFTEKTGAEMEKALKEFASCAAGKIKGVVIDLRGNGGGVLEAAIDILGNFLPKSSEVLSTRGNLSTGRRVYRTKKEPVMPSMPLAVLIDGGSASASEVMAGALQDLDRAVLIGSRSFGKGLVQATLSMPDNAMLKVTSSRYYIPSGRLIQEMDYSHRDNAGNATSRPDSLRSVFHTRSGREVLDGGGLQPDVKIDFPRPTLFVYDLVEQNVIFNFSVKYAAEHPSIAPPELFAPDDEIYSAFKQFAAASPLKHDRSSDKAMATLRKSLELDGRLSQEVTSRLAELDSLLRPDISAELDSLRPVVEPLLASAIVERYYFTRGEVRNSLRNDESLQKAAEILLDPKRYKALLSPAKKQ